MTIKLLLVLILLAPNYYTQWFWQNPFPQGGDIQSMAFTDSVNGYAGGVGFYLRTTDGGLHWVFQKCPLSSGAITKIYFLKENKNIGFILGSDGEIMKTSDAGITWQTQTRVDWMLQSVFFLDDNNGYIVGNGGDGIILKTTDGGTNWIQKPITAYNGLWTVYFTDVNTGYVAGSGFFKTTDGGDNWVQIKSGAGFFISIVCVNDSTSYVCRGDGNVLKTTNKWKSWTIQPLINKDWLDMVFINEYTGIILVSHNYIYKTTNGGIDWIGKEIPGPLIYSGSLQFIDSNHVYIAGSYGAMLKSVDGGESWIDISKGNRSNLNSIYFPSKTLGFSSGDNGTILKTTDGGDHWISKSSGTFQYLISITFPDTINGFALCYNGAVLKSTDSGEDWSIQPIDTSVNLNSFYFNDHNLGYICGNNGVILKTTDAGNSWKALSSGISNNFYSISSPSKNIVYTGGSWGVIIKSTDGGSNWNELYIPSTGTLDSINSLYFLNDDLGYATTEYRVLKTTDGGSSWITIAYDIFSNFKTVVFENNNVGLIINNDVGVPSENIIYSTSNGGVSWFGYILPTRYYANAGFFTDENTGYIAGGGGLIMKTTNGGVTFIKNEKNLILNDFTLYQNYPNPFNPSTHIKIRIPQRTNVSLIVYDMLGRKISTLFEGEKEAGEYNIEFKPDNISSSMYIYQLRTPTNTISKKMIYLK